MTSTSTSCRQKALMPSKLRYNVKMYGKYIMITKVYHDITTTKLCQEYVIKSHLRHDVRKCDITSKCVMTSNSTP